MSTLFEVKAYLYEAGIEYKDHELNRLYRSTVQAILSYCNLRTLPKGLEPLVTDMMITAIEVNQDNDQTDGLDALGGKNIRSVSIGRVSYTYGDDKRTQALSNNVDAIIHDYKAQLNKYRKLNW